jgi:hypothetical protein
MKRWLFPFAIILLIATLPTIFRSTRPSDSINQYNFDRIETGMTQAEVEQILGGPDDEGQGDGCCFPMTWLGRSQNVITVHFANRDGHVAIGKEFFNPGLWDRVKAWCGGYELCPVGGRGKPLKVAA